MLLLVVRHYEIDALQIQSQLVVTQIRANAAAHDGHHLHAVEFVPGTHLARLFPGLRGGTTNSIHHQGIKDLAPGFEVEARCPQDGVIEAVRWRGTSFVAGVQWHPEFHAEHVATADPHAPETLDDDPMLHDFLAAARQARNAR